MNLNEQLAEELKTAMKAQDVTRRDTLRMVRAAIKNVEVDVQHALNDEEVLDVIRREAKRRRESIEEFRRGNRPDLVEKETAELAILETYLPQQMTREEIQAAARVVIKTVGAETKAQAGLVMKSLMTELKGRADGKVVSQVVSELLN